ncbi:hypothetical protein MPF19_13645 [Polaribacter sp. Z014]|uniref:hypothetical protein n=1 Tax=Polaribacter sp. Z014 TaxID=2927126 RepID=UPI0020205277|nr:hypothetical protein [Polaribacter sp. Z014]MCL7764462.1 hypothetical protein [Polaribacter sp. Z014]
MNKERLCIKIYPYNLEKDILIDNLLIYSKYVNWVKGDFDLYFMTESFSLKIYFPNGWFEMVSLNLENNQILLKIVINGNTSISCKKILERLISIYIHLIKIEEGL